MRISDWSSDVCSSDLYRAARHWQGLRAAQRRGQALSLAGEVLQQRYVIGHAPPDIVQRHALIESMRIIAARFAEGAAGTVAGHEIGRASCRERVCQYV